MNKTKNIAIIAFDSKKTELIEWSYFNKKILIPHNIISFGFSGNILEGTLNKKIERHDEVKPGENTQLRNLICKGEIDALIIFCEADEIAESKNLIAVFEAATEHNIILATNKTTADFILHSSLLESEYKISKQEKKLTEKELIDKNNFFSLAKAS